MPHKELFNFLHDESKTIGVLLFDFVTPATITINHLLTDSDVVSFAGIFTLVGSVSIIAARLLIIGYDLYHKFIKKNKNVE